MIERKSPNEPVVVFLKALASAIVVWDDLPPRDRSSEKLVGILDLCLDGMPEILDRFPGVYENEHIIEMLRVIRHDVDTFLKSAKTNTSFWSLICENFPKKDS